MRSGHGSKQANDQHRTFHPSHCPSVPQASVGAGRTPERKVQEGHQETVPGTRDGEDGRAAFNRRKTQQPLSPVTASQLLPPSHSCLCLGPE